MAEQPFKVRKLNVNGSYILAGDFDPSVTGLYAPIPSLYFKLGNSDAYGVFSKTGSLDTDWIPLANKSIVDQMNAIFYGTGEPSGFPIDQTTGEVDRTSSTISFNESNRQFTIAPSGSSYYFFTRGVKYTKSSSITLTLPNTADTYYIYFDFNGDLQYYESASFPISIMLLNVFVAVVVWNGTKAVLVGDERHGSTMDAHTHARLHSNQGSVYLNGMALNNFTLDADGSSDTHAQFSIGSGQFRDEDILHITSSISSTTAIPELYKLNSGTWHIETKTNFKFLVSSSNIIEYNYYNSGTSTWSRVQVQDNKFVLRHVLATNDIRYPYISLMGLNEHLTKSGAREAALTELLTYTGLPFVEFVPIATYIVQSNSTYTNSVNAIIVSTDTGASYIDWRKTGTYLNPNVSGVNVHNNLGGLQGGDAGNFFHSNQQINTTSTVQFAGIVDTGKLSINTTTISTTGTLTDISTSNISSIRFTPSTTTDISSFANGEDGKILIIQNAGSVDITINNDTGSTASNRIHTGRGINVLFKVNTALILQYDSTSSRWRIVTSINPTIHNELDNINGESPYYHSNQEINTTSSPSFANLTLTQNGTLTFEGSTDNAYETTLTVVDPTEDRTITIPDATTTMVGTDVEQTLSNKTLSSPSITGTTTITSTNTSTSPFTITANSLQDGVSIIKVSGSEPDIHFNQVSSGGYTTFTFAVNNVDKFAFGKNSNDDFYITRNNSGWVNDTFVISRTTGNVSISSTTDSSSLTTGSFITSGGVAITKNLNVGNNISIYNQNSLRFMDNDSSNYIGFKAPSSLSADITYTLPLIDGTNGQVLTTNGSGTLSFTTINQNHNSLTGLQGGNLSNSTYYHSDQEINIASSPTFAGLTVAGFTLPTTDGSANHVLTTNGSKGLSYAQVSHANLSNLQGGTTESYYHSNQQIDNTSDVTFKSASLTETLAYNTAYTYSSSGGNLTSSDINSSNTNLRLNPSGIATIHGINDTATGKVIILQNVSSYTITIANNSSTETTASKRIITGAEGSITLKTNASIKLMYDGTSSRWRVIGLTKHNNFYDLQGGGSDYYHSDQPINIANDVQFGTVSISGAYSFPKTLGSSGQALISNGSALAFGTPTTTLDAYIVRYSATLNLDATVTLATIIGSNANGRYEFWLNSDPRVRGRLFVKSDDLSNSELEISSSKIGSVSSTSNRLNVYFSTSNIVFENKIANDTLIVLKTI